MNIETAETPEQETTSTAGVFSEPETPEVETTETPKVETPALTPEQITAAVRDGVAGAQPAAPEKQYSQDELNQMFKVWNPTEELITDLLGGGEKAIAAVVAMRQGLLTQFDTLSMYRLQLLENKILEQLKPTTSFAQEAAATKDREAFFTEHEDLKDYEPLVQTVFNALKAEGFQAKDKAEAYKVLADRTRALLPNNNGNGSGATQSGGARRQTTTQPVKRPAQLSSGSQAGGGGGGSAPAGPFPGAEIWSD